VSQRWVGGFDRRRRGGSAALGVSLAVVLVCAAGCTAQVDPSSSAGVPDSGTASTDGAARDIDAGGVRVPEGASASPPDSSGVSASEAGIGARPDASPAGTTEGGATTTTEGGATTTTEGGATAGFDGGGPTIREAGTDSGLDGSALGEPDGSDSGPSASELAWLTPMNAARAMVGEAPLHWDPIAAQVALAYANQCNYAHNPNAGAQYKALGGSGGLGENIAAGAPSQTVAGAVSSWVSELASYDHATNQCAAGKECGHYTQIVWSTTTGVGCAQASCTTNSPFGTFANGVWDFEVCDFSPPGNINGRPPY
jgi:pathogenesis-related protein 1